jgi:hypothetical protein
VSEWCVRQLILLLVCVCIDSSEYSGMRAAPECGEQSREGRSCACNITGRNFADATVLCAGIAARLYGTTAGE